MERRNRRRVETLRGTGARGRGVLAGLLRQPSHTDAAVESVNKREKYEGDGEKRERELIGFGVFDGLDAVVNGDGNGAGSAGKISANHEDDPKFAESVSESKDESGDHTGN